MPSDDVRKTLSAALKEGRLEDADARIRQELALRPDSEELTYFQGALLLAQGKKEKGLEKLKEALNSAEERSNYTIAIAAAARISAANPEDVNVRLRRADLYLMMGLEHAAYGYLLREFDFYRSRNDPRSLSYVVKKITTIDEANLDLTLKMAKILCYLEQKEEARGVVESVVFTLQGQGKYDEAAKIQKEFGKLYEEL